MNHQPIQYLPLVTLCPIIPVLSQVCSIHNSYKGSDQIHVEYYTNENKDQIYIECFRFQIIK